MSGTESDSDSVLSPDLSPPPTTGILAASLIQPLSSIAERRSGSGEGEESDEDEEDEVEEEEWRVDDGRKLRKADGDSVIKTGYLWKKGERRKVRLAVFVSAILSLIRVCIRRGRSGGLFSALRI